MAWSTACLRRLDSALFTSTAVRSCSSCSSEMSCGFVFLIAADAVVALLRLIEVGLRLRELRAARREHRLDALDGRLRLRRIDLEQELARP